LSRVILRVIHATFAASDTAAVLAMLRAEAATVRTWDGLLTWTHGLRRDGAEMHGLTLTAWTDFDAIRAIAAGRIDRDLSSVQSTGILRNLVADHFEVVEPDEEGHPVLDGAVLGVVRGMVKPGSEPRVHELLRDVRAEVAAAGVEALHVGRRVIAGMTELLVVAVWRERVLLHEFARHRTGPTISSVFTDELTAWRFETYDAITASRISVPAHGPAALVIDDAGALVDVTDGVEAVLGFPGELILRRPLADVVSAASAAGIALLLDTVREGDPCELPSIVVQGGDGRGNPVTVPLHATPNDPAPGLHTLLVERSATWSRGDW
jgi:hypothetical protein